jgi:hypothetical protein
MGAYCRDVVEVRSGRRWLLVLDALTKGRGGVCSWAQPPLPQAVPPGGWPALLVRCQGHVWRLDSSGRTGPIMFYILEFLCFVSFSTLLAA